MLVLMRVPSSVSYMLSMPCRLTAFMSLVRPPHSLWLRSAPVSRRLLSAANMPLPIEFPVNTAPEDPPAAGSSSFAASSPSAPSAAPPSSSILSAGGGASAGAAPPSIASSMSTSPSISRGAAAAASGLSSSTAILRQNSVASVNWMPSSTGSTFAAALSVCFISSITESTLPEPAAAFFAAVRLARARLACSSSSASSASSHSSALSAGAARSASDALLALSRAAW
mmetsp:Transcript_15348/g.39529  ORF Transcript_15348/g.39529 Transcript_15348/m.39529 type:complete len:227 (+) Transcript_15348:561-1241(+)